MKTKNLIADLQSLATVPFRAKSNGAAVTIGHPFVGSGDVRVYVGDGDADNDFQYLDAAALRELAKKFKAIADAIDAGSL